MLPINQNQIPMLYKQALALKAKGDGDGARKLLEQILAARPKTAEAHFQLGELYLMALDFGKSSSAYAKAAALKPREGAIWSRWAEALIRLDDPKATSVALKQLAASGLPEKSQQTIAARFTANESRTKVETGDVNPRVLQEVVSLLNAGNFTGAEAKIRAQLATHGSVALLWNMLATTLLETNRVDQAEEAALKATQLDNKYAEAWGQLGKIRLRNARFQEAVNTLETARSLTPNAAPVLRSLATAYKETAHVQLALKTIDQAIKSEPKAAESHFVKAQLLSDTNAHNEALQALDRCASLGFKTPAAITLRASTLNALDRGKEAVGLLGDAIAEHPEFAGFHRSRANILQSLGKFDEARDDFLDAIRLTPLNGENYRALSASHKFTEDDPLISELETIWERDDLKDQDRAQLGYALSKAMEDTRQYSRVFAYLNTSNGLIRKTHPYNIATRRKEIDSIKKAFAGFQPDNHPLTNTDEDYAPIFVTGMPRSGTTLVEQIISSHSQVTGAGELGQFARSSYKYAVEALGGDNLDKLNSDKILELTEDYKKFVAETVPGAGQITDKSIQTYLFMGFVWLTMPKARIIVVRRDPRDNLLSIYKNLFPEGSHLYSYDLEDLAAYYKMFLEMIDFWREIAPERFYEVHYEDLISDPEPQSRALIDAAGLTWEDACLNFHQNKRRVDTLSVYQVRQPIYKSSMKAWQRYEDDLQPLIKALGDLV